ncbi:4-hydroxyphenylpyruvate dioxygenase [Kitasatospora sp. NPDC085464]|uniref:4-hydroxyphenylpyruvate dioxygenase n=1 Tax=Kitasatospora sp. NPDC085464 TaxID=3364063 RepID=UPI0037C738DB
MIIRLWSVSPHYGRAAFCNAGKCDRIGPVPSPGLCSLFRTVELHTVIACLPVRVKCRWLPTIAKGRPGVAISKDPVDLIRARAAADPARVAVEMDGVAWTYDRLLDRARRFSALLDATEVGDGDVVLVRMARSPEAVAVMLGTLMSGAAYLPVEPGVPHERLRTIVEQARPRLAVGTEPSELPPSAPVWVPPSEAFTAPPADPPAAAPSGRGSAYLIFTSGSTGTPKGVVVSRAALSWHAETTASAYDLRPDDRVLHATSLGFDVAAEEIWPTLAAGATLVVLPTELGSTGFEEFTERLADSDVTVCNLPASYFAGWAPTRSDLPTRLPHLRLVVVGSEQLPAAPARQWLADPRSPRLINAYGLSEATVTSITCELTPEILSNGQVPLGTPLDGMRAEVVDRDLRPVRAGEPGELLLSGPGLAEGYLGDRELTDSRFITRSGGQDAERWLRTGDIVRETDGLLVFHGRSDDQLNIAGRRIEPGEVVHALLSATGARDARVVELEGQLVACLVGLAEIDEAGLRTRLAASLPAHMIPGRFLHFDALPTAAGGKVDLAALRAVVAESHRPEAAEASAPDATPAELAELWAQVLVTDDPIGEDANFFALGGTSLLAARLLLAVRRRWGLALALDDVFAAPRLVDMCAALRRAAPVTPAAATTAAVRRPTAPVRGIRATTSDELGLAYVELYVDDLAADSREWVDQYGFQETGRRGSAAEGFLSSALRQGDILLVLTQGTSPEHPASRYVRAHGRGIADIALRTPDVRAFFDGAVRRGARAVTGPATGDGGAVTATIGAFGDLVHTLVQADGSGGSGLPPGFAPVAAAEGTSAGPGGRAGLERVDHFAVCVPAGELDTTIAFYRQVLGFRETFRERIVVGSQAMLSKVVQSASGAVTFTVIEPDTGSDPGQIDGFLTAHAGAGVQHVAFATGDIVESVATLRGRGVAFLTTPGAYYDLLARRIDPKRHSPAELREHHVLLDEDHAGQLFQIFTRSSHPRRTLFFEVIERIGAETFGSANIKALYEAVEVERSHTDGPAR